MPESLKNITCLFFFVALIPCIPGCRTESGGDLPESDRFPRISPDYTDISIPYNIAPLNFVVKEKGSAYFVRISSENDTAIRLKSRKAAIRIPQGKWKKLLSANRGKQLNIEIYAKQKKCGWIKYKTVTNVISSEAVDPFVTYRLILPGYERWSDISIRQRDIRGFREWPLIKNSVADRNCVNCHSFNNGRTDDFLFHMRGSRAGTYFYSEGKLIKINLKTPEMKNGPVYPRWHPSGRFVAFSANNIVQQFHSANGNKVEVSDLESSLLLYDTGKNEIMPVDLPDRGKYMDTYPEWSPDGRMMYFCRTSRLEENYDYRHTRYDLYRVSFDPSSRRFGEPELVINASEKAKSISFPRISPDGRFLAMTYHDYGCFPVWHREADLILLNLETLEIINPELNSDFPESYHSWSSNGRWLLFASRRDDGLATRPYLAYVGQDGKSGKAFIMPRRNPEHYNTFLKSYNLPEFSNLKITMNPGRIRNVVTSGALQAEWGGK